jgi:hypothetical protein
MSQTAYPHTEAAYWLIHADDAFSLEVITPWDHPITVSPFSTAADAEAWIAEHRWRAQFESEARNSANGGAAPFPARAPSTCQVRLAGYRRWQCALGIYDQPMRQISPQTWNVWVLEALCSAAVT